MEFEFDKEIDSLLRQSARGETVSVFNNPHLDADEISLFAENALPEKTKTVYTKHFADCERCRKILSNVVSQNSETHAETVHAKEIKLAAAASIPWYRRLFAAPNLAYALGALVLIFGALIAFTFLKSVPQNSEISQTREAPSGNNGGETKTIESNAATTNSVSAMSNAGSIMSNASRTNSAVVSNGSNAASTANNSSFSNSAPTTNKQSLQKSEPAKNDTTQSETPKNAAPVENNSVDAKKEKIELQAGAMNLAEQRRTASEKEETVSVNSNSAKSDADAAAPVASSAKPQMRVSAGRAAPMAKQNRIMKTESVETRQVGGKTFSRENNVWYDSAYGGQGATNVRRGSEDFKKLDAGLRSVADSLGGTIVVLWKGKAYRIQ